MQMCIGVICHKTYHGFLLSCPKSVDAAHSNYEAKIYVFDLYKIAFNFLMFNLKRHQRGLFSPGQLQWLLPAM